MSYKPPVKDEIPGITGYLYEANRFREEHEYRDHWKWKRRVELKAEQHGIKDLSLENLVDLVIRLRNQMEEGSQSYSSLEDQWCKLEEQHKQLERTHKKLSDEHSQVKPTITHLEQQLKIWQDATMDYGEHHDDCGWIELIQSGRVVDSKEEDYCTCGWYKKRMDLKKDPRYRLSRPKEVIVVKKRESGQKFKINLDIE